jgi:cytochrome bd-type quinol oxidase subunit 2
LNDDTILTKTKPIDHKRILIVLIVILVVITVIYQVRPFVDDSQFAWISIPVYSILPATLVVYASILTVKLYKQKNYQAKAFFLFALGAGCWFVAEQLWQAYDHIWEGAPFPSEADIFT